MNTGDGTLCQSLQTVHLIISSIALNPLKVANIFTLSRNCFTTVARFGVFAAALQMPASERALVTNSAMQMVTECHLIITECMDMLHPSPPKKWNYLHQALEIYHNVRYHVG